MLVACGGSSKRNKAGSSTPTSGESGAAAVPTAGSGSGSGGVGGVAQSGASAGEAVVVASAGSPELGGEGGAGGAPELPPGPVRAIGVGDGYACAALETRVVCWGRGDVGQLGNDSTESSAEPVPVRGVDGPVAALAVGYRHACALVDGKAYCWGANDFSQLGDGSSSDAHVAKLVTGLPAGATAIGAGSMHSCALAPESSDATVASVYCWGDNRYGQVGGGSTQRVFESPTRVYGQIDGVHLAVGELNTCTVTHGSIQCSGWRLTPGVDLIARMVDGTTDASAVSAGSQLICMLREGAASCWGKGELGSIGNGANLDSETPQPVADLTTEVSVVSAGGGQACAVKKGIAYCWGANAQGEVGDGTTEARPAPVRVENLPVGASALATGPRQSCAVVNGHAYCWGQSDAAQSLVAQQVPAL